MDEVIVGIVTNPLSGRDIRRLVAHASVVPNAEKANMVQRLLLALRAGGVGRVLLSVDLAGISAAVARAVRTLGRRAAWPEVEFLDEEPVTESADDTVNAVTAMVGRGASTIVCLGGDGTARLAAAACGATPLLALSTGTNNVFPRFCEATVAGLAAALVATGAVGESVGLGRASMLEVTAGDRREIALVDVGVASTGHVGAKALWDPSAVRQVFCTFAEPDAIGLSSIAGLVRPSPRSSPEGVMVRLADPATAATSVLAPIAPGLLVDVGIESCETLRPGELVTLVAERGVISLDGERAIELDGTEVSIRLRPDGPRCVDVGAVLAEAAATGALRDRGAPRPRRPPLPVSVPPCPRP